MAFLVNSTDMEMLRKVACLLVLCMVVIAPHAEAALTCGQVTSSVAGCIPYLRSGGTVPAACCAGVRGLNSAAKTTPDRQFVCRCFISVSKSIKGINFGNIGKVAGSCGVTIPNISPSTDCSKIK